MKAILRDTRTDELIVEIMDNLEIKLTDDEVQGLIEGYEFSPEELENMYIDYI